MSSNSLVQSLFDDPVDIVGDIHGEIEALHDLLGKLGYAADGAHREGRRLVFLGDLIDRGPDSPAVVAEVKRLVESGRAQSVLGNHDLNILLGEKKGDNHWFFGEPWSLDGSDTPTPAVLADDCIRKTVVDFFRTLPLVLEREEMRVVHACWDEAMVDSIRHATDVEAVYRRYDDQIRAEHASRPELDEVDRGLERQNRHPVKVLTSGKERRVDTPFRASGKLRHEERVRWWETYAGPACIFGHYGTFKDETPRRGRAICIDFGVGKRWMERIPSAFAAKFRAKLGAVRLPEKVLILDDGHLEPIHMDV
jgi:hypothetical protein